MDVVVALESRFSRTPDGSAWTRTAMPYSFWTRYLRVFDGVKILARAENVERVDGEWLRVSGDGVSLLGVPNYLGPFQYVRRRRSVRAAIRAAFDPRDAQIMRVGSQIAACMEPLLRENGHPFGLEVVGDPDEVFTRGAIQHPLRPFFRWWFRKQLQRQCLSASAIAYVTQEILQKKYPCKSGDHSGLFTTHYSSVELDDASFRARTEFSSGPTRIVTVASLAQPYKGVDLLLEAVARCAADGLDVSLTVVGDGVCRAELESLAGKLGIRERARFLGYLPAGPRVREELDRADLFVLASRTEGLPRAMVEAMARGLPCVGTAVGGMQELLPPEDLVPPGDAGRLAAKIREITSDPARMRRSAEANFRKAAEFRADLLAARRDAFYRHVRAVTEAWLARRSVPVTAG